MTKSSDDVSVRDPPSIAWKSNSKLDDYASIVPKSSEVPAVHKSSKSLKAAPMDDGEIATPPAHVGVNIADQSEIFKIPENVARSRATLFLRLKNAKYQPLESPPDISLKDILNKKTKRPISFAEFQTFIRSEHDHDNLDFWLLAEDYKSSYANSNSNDLGNNSDFFKVHQEKMENLANKYIKAGAPCELNLSAGLRKQTVKAISSGAIDPAPIIDVQKYVYDLMNTNSFPRFLQETVSYNIGENEIEFRRMSGYLGIVISIVTIVLFFTISIPRNNRWALFVPVFFTLLMFLQMQQHFCVVYALMGKIRRAGFGLYGLLKGRTGEMEPVAETCVLSNQREKAIRMIGLTAVVSLLPTIIVYFIPYYP